MKTLRTLPLLIVLGALFSSFSMACGDDHHDHRHERVEKEIIVEPRH